MFIDTGPSAARRCGDCLSRKTGWGSALLCGRATSPKDLVLPVGHIVKSYFYPCILPGMHAFVFLVPSGQKESCPWPRAYLQQQWAFAGKVRVPMYSNQVKIDVDEIVFPPSASQRDYEALESEQPLDHLPQRVVVCESVLPISLCFKLQSKTKGL